MEQTRGVVAAVATIVVVTALFSGPLGPGISLTATSSVTYGEGTVTVSSTSLPERATFEGGSYGSERYHLTVPATSIEFASLEGGPILAYRIEIDALNYSRSTTHFLDESITSPYELTMQSDDFDADQIQQNAYDGTISVVVRDSAGERTVAERAITIEVVE
jgi:hypothetical protein